MKKFNFALLFIVAFGILAAYANKPAHPSPKNLHIYSFQCYSVDHSKMYIGFDCTAEGWTQGLDYSCDATNNLCTFYADPTREHLDLAGDFFYVWDVPGAGYLNTGNFIFIN